MGLTKWSLPSRMNPDLHHLQAGTGVKLVTMGLHSPLPPKADPLAISGAKGTTCYPEPAMHSSCSRGPLPLHTRTVTGARPLETPGSAPSSAQLSEEPSRNTKTSRSHHCPSGGPRAPQFIPTPAATLSPLVVWPGPLFAKPPINSGSQMIMP